MIENYKDSIRSQRLRAQSHKTAPFRCPSQVQVVLPMLLTNLLPQVSTNLSSGLINLLEWLIDTVSDQTLDCGMALGPQPRTVEKREQEA